MAEPNQDHNHHHHNHNPLLPQDLIVSEILIRLPVKSLCRFKSVSKQWNTQISSSKFTKTHFLFSISTPSQSTTPFPISFFIKSIKLLNIANPSSQFLDRVIQIDGLNWNWNWNQNPNVRVLLEDLYCGFMEGRSVMVGSCNGLVCVVSYGTGRVVADNFHVYNPITARYRKIPNPVQDLSVSGFGYVRESDEYRLVTLCMCKHGTETFVYVYSLGKGEWRSLVGVHDYEFEFFHGNGVFVDDGLYFLVTLRLDPSEKYVVRFDLVDETVRLIEMPMAGFGRYGCRLCVVDGSLCAWEESDMVPSVELWRLWSSEVRESWTKLVRLDGVRFHLLGRGGNFLYFDEVVKRLIYYDSYGIKFVDLNKDKLKHVPLVEHWGGCQVVIVNYVPTLVSPLDALEPEE